MTLGLVSGDLLASEGLPLGRGLEGVVDELSSLSGGLSALDVSSVEDGEIEGLEQDAAGEDAQDRHVGLETGLVVWLLVGLVQLRTDDVTGAESDVEETGHGSFFCPISDPPKREPQRCTHWCGRQCWQRSRRR